MATSIKKNFVFNIILTLSTYIINIFLFPYVSRTLGVENVGKIGFVTNVITYFTLFAMLGVGNVGIREIAKYREDRAKRSKVFSEIICILLILMSIVLVCYLIAIFSVPRLKENINLFIIGVPFLLSSSFLLEWLYQGMENFKFITKRSIIIRIMYALSVVLIIHSPKDYYIYFCLTTLTWVANSIINILYARKFVDFTLKGLDIKRHIKSVLSLGLFKIMTSMYTTFNILYLGFVCSDTEVGYYYTSTKLFYIILGVMTAFTSVMLPRMSYLAVQSDKTEFNNKIINSFELVFSCAMPLAIYCILFAPQIISLLAGSSFEGAILPMRIIMPLIILTSMSQIYIIQTLTPLKKDKIIMCGSCVGAVVAIIANILLVERYGAIGSALVLLCSEICCFLVSFIYSTRKHIVKFPYSKFMKNIVLCMIYMFVGYVILSLDCNTLVKLLLSVIVFLLIFTTMHLFVIKGTFINNQLKSIIKVKKYVNF